MNQCSRVELSRIVKIKIISHWLSRYIFISKYLYIIRCFLLKYRLIFFTSLESIWRAFRLVKYRKTSKNISRYFKRRHLIIYLLSNSKNFTLGVKILEFKSDRRHQDFPKSKICTNHLNQNILGGGVIFWGVQIRGVKFSTYENVRICNGYRVSDIFRIGDKILQVG